MAIGLKMWMWNTLILINWRKEGKGKLRKYKCAFIEKNKKYMWKDKRTSAKSDSKQNDSMI